MGLLLLAQDQIAKHWWFVFVDYCGNTASVVGLLLTLIAFPITWRIQAKIRKETRKAMDRVAWMVLKESMEQVLFQITMTKESANVVMWQRAVDFCEAARQGALRSLGNPHLTEQEKTDMRAHADNLTQVLTYIRANKLGPNAPAVFQQDKRTVLENMHTFITNIQIRLNAKIWEA